jgi:Permuted papain-like amidase enzyme, YaeF/YiiX, C92 family
MLILDSRKLLPGDVVLTAEARIRSKAVRKATNSQFSHALLYLGGSSYIHSDGSGVHSGNTQRLLFDEQSQALVLRLCNRLEAKISSMCMFARTQIGKEYSVPEAVRSKFKRSKDSITNSNRQFCSRLVSQAYAYAGIQIVKNPGYCYPQDIADSPLMMVIDGCLRSASADEIDFAESDSPIDKQTAITNSILSDIRALSGADIQTFEQVAAYLLAYPQHDQEISEIFQKSGYLVFWQIDVQKNPWHYDSEAFLALDVPRSQKLEIAKEHRSSAEGQLKQFQFMYGQYMQLWQKAQLKYFALEIALYLKLIELTKSRVAAADYVLANA